MTPHFDLTLPTPPFVIGYQVALNVTSPNVASNIYEVGMLIDALGLNNLTGSCAILALVDLSNPSTNYQFSTVGNGNSNIVLNDQIVISRTMVTVLPSIFKQRPSIEREESNHLNSLEAQKN